MTSYTFFCIYFAQRKHKNQILVGILSPLPMNQLYVYKSVAYSKRTSPESKLNTKTGEASRCTFNPLKVKVKLSLCFNLAPHHEGVVGEWRYSSTHS
jgi:hypothetical protein